MRSVPETYPGLSAAVDAGAFPSERSWIDFKRRLYPDDPGDREGRAKVSLELAKDLASMAVSGGYLIYGVAENKAKHLFTVDPMNLAVGLHETVDAVARDRITPPLSVFPALLPDPADTTRGFLVVEVPASPDAPHMVDGAYWGRSETGKVRLADTDVERLILARSRRAEYLHQAMRATAEADPVPSTRYCHFYLTAVPATGWPDMFLAYTGDHRSRTALSMRCTSLLNEISKTYGERPEVAFRGMIHNWRSQKVAGAWLGTRGRSAAEQGGRVVGVDDDGPVRFIDLAASVSFPDRGNLLLIRELSLMFETWDMLRLIAVLSEEAGYRGAWLFGVELDNLSGHMSQVSGFIGPGTTWEAEEYSQTTRGSALEVREKPRLITSRLLRHLLRGLGTEQLLGRLPSDPVQ